MERFKKFCDKVLHPHPVLTVLLALVSFGALAWVFLNGMDTHWIAYPVYVLAFYALTVLCIWCVPAVIRLAKKKKEKEADKDQQVREKELKNSLNRHLWINGVYGVGQIIQGCWVSSAWVGANGIYNVLFGICYAILAAYERKLERLEDDSQRQYLAWKGYRNCGCALFGLNLSMTGIAFQMIWWGRGEHYTEVLVIAVAAYTFYKLTLAVIRVVGCRKNNSPMLGAARNMALTESLMSLFSLQAAMFAAFGQGFDQQFLMNSLTGGAVCLSTMLGGVGMVLHGKRKMREVMGETESGK